MFTLSRPCYFFGSIYSKEHRLWEGHPVAIILTGSRESTFKASNVKAQGTVLGTVYGILGCFVFGKYVQISSLSFSQLQSGENRKVLGGAGRWPRRKLDIEIQLFFYKLEN